MGISASPALARVRVTKKDHPKCSDLGAIVRTLPNPSERPENQWYDVRFDDGTYGRFIAADLQEGMEQSECA